jgi:ferric-dicitrate binding protein FerR (iron transport regulator)
MSAWGCREVEARLVEAVDGRLDAAASVRLHAHIESCGTCRERAALWRDLTPALRALEPEPPEAMATRRMQLEIERQLARAVVSPRRRWRWIWAPAALSLAGAAAAALLWLHRPAPPRGAAPNGVAGFATLARLSGTVTVGGRALGPSATIPVGSTLALGDGAEADLAMARGTEVHLAGSARVTLAGTAAAVTLRLDDGALAAAVAHRLAGETFAVVTPDARVEVRGTRFSVVKGREGSSVRVDEGRVFVQFVDGRTRFVSAGESATSFEPAVEPAAPADETAPTLEPATVPDAPAARALTCAGAMRACRETTGAVRASMREGEPGHALRTLSERGRTTSELEARCGGDDLGACQDELRYLRAEALNQAGRLDDAIAAYHALDRRSAPPAMRQNALYAAAQIERRRGHDGAARTDYERALDAAPQGALREETLIGAMETAQASADPRRAGALARRYLGEFPNGIGAPTARRLVSSPR